MLVKYKALGILKKKELGKRKKKHQFVFKATKTSTAQQDYL
jgi:hypothetical protein